MGIPHSSHGTMSGCEVSPLSLIPAPSMKASITEQAMGGCFGFGTRIFLVIGSRMQTHDFLLRK